MPDQDELAGPSSAHADEVESTEQSAARLDRALERIALAAQSGPVMIEPAASPLAVAREIADRLDSLIGELRAVLE